MKKYLLIIAILGVLAGEVSAAIAQAMGNVLSAMENLCKAQGKCQ